MFLMMWPRKWLLPVLVLLIVIGLGFSWKRSGFPDLSDVPHAADVSGSVSDGFGPIPGLAAPDDRIRHATQSRPFVADALSEAERNLADRMSQRTEDLQVISHADGRRSVNLGGRFMHMSAVVTGPDGNPEVRCFTDYQEMAAALSGGASPVKPQASPHVR